MPIKTFQFAFILVMAITIIAFGQTTTAADYFPLEVGNRWEYQMNVSPDRQTWQITRQDPKQNNRFLIEIETIHLDADGKRRRTSSTQRWVSVDGSRLLMHRGNQDNVWVDFAIPAGQSYPSPGLCHKKAANSPGAEAFTVLYERACGDAGLLEETFVAHVGLRSFTEDSFAGARAWHLIAGHVGGKDLAF